MSQTGAVSGDQFQASVNRIYASFQGLPDSDQLLNDFAYVIEHLSNMAHSALERRLFLFIYFTLDHTPRYKVKIFKM